LTVQGGRAAPITVVGLGKNYGRRSVLQDFSLEVAAGSFTALLGASGSGKTTLLRCLSRLVAPEAGEMWVAGHPMHALRGRALAAARRDIGFVFQGFNLVRRLSALDNVASGRLSETPLWRILLRQPGAVLRQDALHALARVGLADHAEERADRLSGGQQQRVAIARALLQNSRVLLADEPVASLDPESSLSVLTLMRDIALKEGLTVLCSLHQHDLAHRFADRIVTMPTKAST
jgi:phosphonate transport system ATP-binding protein